MPQLELYAQDILHVEGEEPGRLPCSNTGTGERHTDSQASIDVRCFAGASHVN